MEKEKKIRSDTIEAVRADYLQNNFKENESYRRNRFNHALDVEILEDVQFGNDYQIISESLIEWKSKIKQTDSRWLVLNIMSGSLMRMYFYAKQLETKLRAAVSEYQIFREQNNRLLDANEKLRNEIKALKNEIEFLNKDG
jgi:hypothetical protein